MKKFQNWKKKSKKSVILGSIGTEPSRKCRSQFKTVIKRKKVVSFFL